MVETGEGPGSIIERQGLVQVKDTGAIEGAVRRVMDEHPDNVAAYKAGKHALMGWFVGQVMKATSGRANPKLVNETLRRMLDQNEAGK
jgi:aspartyl-tRNA(Asn)/glutamyl-tRNA(Gln) amidotransferase subunit B